GSSVQTAEAAAKPALSAGNSATPMCSRPGRPTTGTSTLRLGKALKKRQRLFLQSRASPENTTAAPTWRWPGTEAVSAQLTEAGPPAVAAPSKRATRVASAGVVGWHALPPVAITSTAVAMSLAVHRPASASIIARGLDMSMDLRVMDWRRRVARPAAGWSGAGGYRSMPKPMPAERSLPLNAPPREKEARSPTRLP